MSLLFPVLPLSGCSSSGSTPDLHFYYTWVRGLFILCVPWKNCLCRSIKRGLAFFSPQHHRYGSASLKSQHFRDRGRKIRSFSLSVATQRVQSCPSQKQTIGTFLPFVSWFSLFLYGDKFRRLPALSFTLNDNKSVTWRSGVPPHEVLKHEQSSKTLQKLANLLRLGRRIKFPIIFVLLPPGRARKPAEAVFHGMFLHLAIWLEAWICSCTHKQGQSVPHVALGLRDWSLLSIQLQM